MHAETEDRQPTGDTAGGELLDRMAAVLGATRLPLAVPGVARSRQQVRAAADQLRDYIRPRFQSLDAPLLAVVGGSTGAGKSTLVNAVVGKPVTRAGVIRPTTRQPILVHHPADAPWFQGTRVLPGLSRLTGSYRDDEAAAAPAPATSAPATSAPATPDPAPAGAAARATGDAGGRDEQVTSLVLVADAAVPRGIALLDAPDIDSVSRHNRELARQLLAAADLWVFVTTANRYADAVPWTLLEQAAARDILLSVVLDRVPPQPGVADEIATDLRRMLSGRGLDEAQLFTVLETPLNEVGMLNPAQVGSLTHWLAHLAADAEARAAVARRTLAGAIRELAATVAGVADAVEVQEKEAERLRADVTDAYATAHEHVMDAASDGSMLRGEVLARWHDIIGTGDFFKKVESGVGRLRDRLGAFVRGRPAPAVKVEQAIESALLNVVVEETAKAAEKTDSRWRAEASGHELLGDADLARIPDGFRAEAAREIRDWQGDLLDLVRTEGEGKKNTARVLSLGVNVLAVALMIVVFSLTAFIPTGAEVGVGAGAALLGQRLLEAVFGEDAVRRLAETARERLATRMQALLDRQSGTFLRRLDALDVAGGADELRTDAAGLHRLADGFRASAADAAATQAAAPAEPSTEEGA